MPRSIWVTACITTRVTPGLDPGLDPGVHPFRQKFLRRKMDCRVKPGNDDHLHRELLLRAGPQCRRIRSSKFFGCMRLMKGLRHSVRAAIVAAIALTSIAGTTVAEEVTYLMYLKGSEGPPATPFRVLWDVLDQANAHI